MADNLMLAKENRLKKEKEIKRVLREGKSYKSRSLLLKVLKKETTDEPRFGFIVSKKVSSKASARNKVKRRLREAVRPFLPDLKQGLDAVIIAFPEAGERSFEEIKQEVSNLLERAKT